MPIIKFPCLLEVVEARSMSAAPASTGLRLASEDGAVSEAFNRLGFSSWRAEQQRPDVRG